ANTAGPTVPAGVDAVLDLQDLVQFRTANRASASGQGGCVGTVVCVGALTAQDLWSVYDLPATNLGQGQRMAIIGAGSLAAPVVDLRIFEGLYDLPQVPVRQVLVDNVGDYTAGESEWALDSEASTGMAPGVDQLDYYFGESLATGSIAAAFSAWANDPNGPLQANASFGGCESLQALLGGITAMDPVFTQIAAEGRTQFVATGDTGGSCTVVTGNGFLNTVAPQVEYPASSPWVVAVGGTQLYTNGATHPQRVLEKAWDYTGGGTSLYSPRPVWQAQIPAVVGRCAANGALDLTPGTPCRGLPDVAALSGDITVVPGSAVPSYGGDGYRDVEGRQSTTDGGTSLASPLWLGMWTRVQAAAPAVHGRYPGLGFAAPALYRDALSPAKDARDFYDISIGTNGQWRAEARNLTDPTGWDYVSGLGVPDVAHLMLDLTGRLTPAHPVAAGGPTTLSAVPTWRCGPNGVFVHHSGATTPAYASSVAMTRVTLHSSPNAITWTATVPGLATGDQQARTFDFSFAYAGKYYETEADEGLANTGYYLYQLSYSGGSASTTTLASDLTGSFDAARHEVSVTLPLVEFNRLAKPARKLGAGTTLAVMDNNSYYAYGLTGDDIAGDGCPFHLG
ncbi:MAG: S53 family peptidase, partial [Mycobacteriales bacterium]